MDDATLLKKVETAIASNHSLQMLKVEWFANSIVEAILKGACRNISLKELNFKRRHCDLAHHKAVVAEVRRVRPEMNLHLW